MAERWREPLTQIWIASGKRGQWYRMDVEWQPGIPVMPSRGGETPKLEELWLFTLQTTERIRTQTMPSMPISFRVTLLWRISLVVSLLLFKAGILGQTRFA